jgi:hypothetical protein
VQRSIANALDNYAERRIAALCWKDPNIDTALIFRSATSSKYTLLSDIARVRSHPTIHLFNITFSATEKKGGVAGASDWEGLEVSDETAPGTCACVCAREGLLLRGSLTPLV